MLSSPGKHCLQQRPKSQAQPTSSLRTHLSAPTRPAPPDRDNGVIHFTKNGLILPPRPSQPASSPPLFPRHVVGPSSRRLNRQTDRRILGATMAGREKDWDDNEGSPDPETLYTKEYCIGSFCHMSARSAGHSRGGVTGETGDRHTHVQEHCVDFVLNCRRWKFWQGLQRVCLNSSRHTHLHVSSPHQHTH